MTATSETHHPFEAFRQPGNAKNTVQEFAWILNQIVMEDMAQGNEILGSDISSDIFLRGMLYAQRFIEIGYVFTEVFIRDEYRHWEPENTNPRIIDLGGDPGSIAALYWKYRAPEAKVTIVEANPSTAKVMRKNLHRRGLDDVEIVNAAVAQDDQGTTTLNLHRPGTGWHTQDYIGNAATSSDGLYAVEVPKVKLSSLIKDGEVVDLLKIDIEGMEGEVIKELAASGKMGQVKQIIMEFHHGEKDFPGNSIEEMLELLQAHNFSITEAHLTSGKGLRVKHNINPQYLLEIAKRPEKTFITFSATQNS